MTDIYSVEAPRAVGFGPVQRLANAVIEQAARDYCSVLKRLQNKPEDVTAAVELEALERFFHSATFALYTDIDGGMLLSALRVRGMMQRRGRPKKKAAHAGGARNGAD